MEPMMLIDTHAHLDYEYDLSTAELIREADTLGVDTIISIAASAESLDKVLKIAEKFPNVFCTNGIHPHDAKDFSPAILDQIKKNSQHPKCLAIGELGLDYHYNLSEKSVQHHCLLEQLNFSADVGKPIIFHSREAEEDTIHFLEIHSKNFAKKNPQKSPGVIHCFTGSANLAQKAISLGYYISFSGIITFKNADPLREVLKNEVPLERLLVETDSPYLAPLPHRGKKNHPGFTRYVAEKVAEVKGCDFATIADATTSNARRLFSF